MTNVEVFKVKIDAITCTVGKYQDVVNFILQKLEKKQCVTVLPCPLNDIALISNSPELQSIYKKIDIITTDGMPLVWYSQYVLKKSIERVYGPDLMRDILINTQEKNYRHCLYGTTPETLLLLKKKILEFAPKCNIITLISPPFGELSKEEKKAYISQLKKNKINVAWIALSAPKQVQLAIDWKKSLPHTSFFCVGAAFDFISGNKKSAPKIIKQLGFEWLFRLSCEPQRLWKQYLLTIPKYLLKKIFFVFTKTISK